jgi:hypothetical protein
LRAVERHTRDAQLLDIQPPGSHRVETRDPWVWIRHKGAWRKGAIHCWFVRDDAWMAWMQHEPPPGEGPWATWGLYAYDGVTIRRRHHPQATAHIELPADGATNEMRDLGYAVLPQQNDVLVLG